eukprot:6453950-Alexandrium_andersonii.AAC.1
MSASLVGSEMCIRDRALHCGLLLLVEGRQCGWRDRRPCHSEQVRHLVRAVSYTHLTLPTICSV